MPSLNQIKMSIEWLDGEDPVDMFCLVLVAYLSTSFQLLPSQLFNITLFSINFFHFLSGGAVGCYLSSFYFTPLLTLTLTQLHLKLISHLPLEVSEGRSAL